MGRATDFPVGLSKTDLTGKQSVAVLISILMSLVWLMFFIKFVAWIWRVVGPAILRRVSREVLKVEATHVGLLYRDGVFQQILDPGSHRFWGRRYTLRLVDVRPWVFRSDQVLQTADGSQIVLIWSMVATVADPRLLYESCQNHNEELLAWLRLKVREVCAALTLPQIRVSVDVIGDRAMELIVDGLRQSGLDCSRFALEEIRLPPPDSLVEPPAETELSEDTDEAIPAQGRSRILH